MKSCEEMQSKLIDYFYEEKKMDDELSVHLEQCADCQSFLGNLQYTKENLDSMNFDDSLLKLDFESLDRLVDQTINRESRKHTIIDTSIFALIGILILSAFGYMVFGGFITTFLIVQITLVVLLPLSIPLGILSKLRHREVS